MRRGQIVVVVVVAALLGAVGAQPAAAITYCVNNGLATPPNCPLGVDSTKTLPQALGAAAASTAVADTILLAPGTFTALTPGDFSFNSGDFAANDLTIQGAGTGQTTLTRAGDLGSPIVQFVASTANADAILQDLTLSTPPGYAGAAIFEPTELHRVNIVAQGAMSGVALRLSNRGTFDNMDIEMPLTGGASGVYQPNGSLTITDSTIVADNLWGAGSTGSDDVLRNLRLHGNTTGLATQLTNTGVSDAMTADNIQIRMDGPAPAFALTAPFGSPGRFNASHVTIIGNNDPNSIGVRASAPSSPPMAITLANSIITGVAHPLAVVHTTGTATITATSSVFSNSGYTNTGSSGSGVLNTNATDVIADPRLIDSGGVLHPLFNSPAVDHGDLAKTAVATDLIGTARTVDGDGNGVGLPDSGAVEYQHRAPVVTAAVSGALFVGSELAFTGTATDPDPGDTVTVGWNFSDATSALGLTPTHTFATAGPFGGTLLATDSTGLITSAAATGTLADQTVTPPGDSTDPIVALARFDPKTFRASKTANTATSAAAKKKPKRPPVGSKLRFTLSEPASVTIVVAAQLRGRMTKTGARSSCKAPSKANRKGHACTFFTTKKTLTRKSLPKGAGTLPFSGRFANKALSPGAYRVTITPKDPAGNAGAAAAVPFTIAR